MCLYTRGTYLCIHMINKYNEIPETHIIEIDSKTIKMTRTMERDLFAFLFSDH